MKTILFQGDSITDVFRDREDIFHTGRGYPTLVRAEIQLEYPNQYIMYNRGISGDRIVDIYARIKSDIINLKPDIMSILIGVNDVWHEINYTNGVEPDKFYKIYSMLIEEIKAALPDIQIMIMEPFVLEGEATENTEDCPDKWERFNTEVKKTAQKAYEIAQKYELPFIYLQNKFDEAAKLAPNSYWLHDGVHPTPAGHEIIKREWIKCFENLK